LKEVEEESQGASISCSTLVCRMAVTLVSCVYLCVLLWWIVIISRHGVCRLCITTGHFNIYTREAGAGGLSIAVEGPSKAEIDFQDHKDGSCEVAYTCTEPGL